MKQPRLSRVLQGTLILSLSSLIAKILSAVYRVPFQNLVGDTGFYVYQQVYPLYGIGIVLALSGLPVFISKVIAERKTATEQVAIARQLVWLLFWFAVSVVALLWLSAPWLAAAMGDINLTPVIRSVSLMFLGMPFLAVGRGFYQGRYLTWPTSITQLAEQVVRVTMVIVVAVLAFHNHWDVYLTGTWAMLSAPVAAVCSCFIILIVGKSLFFSPIQRKHLVSNWYLVKRLVLEGGVICLFAALMILLQLVDSFTVKNALVVMGMPVTAAMDLKGVFDRGQPLIQLGLVLATSVSALLVPSLTQTYQQHQIIEFKRQFQILLHVCMTVAALCTTGLVVLMPQVNQLLFASQTGSRALALSMLSIVLASLITTYSSVMQSINQFSKIVLGLVVGIVVKVATNFWLTAHLGILGAALATVIALSVTLLIIWSALPDFLHGSSHHGFGTKLTLICLVMAGMVRLVTVMMISLVGPGRLADFLVIGVAIIIGGLVAIVLSVGLRLLSVREVLLLPHGKTILKKLKR